MTQFKVKSDVSNGTRKTPVFKFSLTGFAQRVGRQCRFDGQMRCFQISYQSGSLIKNTHIFAIVWTDSKVAQPSISTFLVKIY
jgi:hypothetical protein